MAFVKSDLAGLFEPAILRAIDEAVKLEVEKITAEAVERLRDSISKITAGVAVELSEMVSFERMGSDIVIHVRHEKEAP